MSFGKEREGGEGGLFFVPFGLPVRGYDVDVLVHGEVFAVATAYIQANGAWGEVL